MLVPGALIALVAVGCLGLVVYLAARQRGRRVLDAMTVDPVAPELVEDPPTVPQPRPAKPARNDLEEEERAWQAALAAAQKRAREAEAEQRVFEVAQMMAERRAWQVAMEMAKSQDRN